MLGVREKCLLMLTLCLGAAPARAQTAPVVTAPDYQSIAELAAGLSLQAPADVNQRPACEDLAIPCLSPQTFTGFGVVLSAGIYVSETVGIVGELNAYPNEWASYDPDCSRGHSTCVVNQTNHVRAALAGLKLRTPLIDGGTARGRFFAQALIGPQWSDVVRRQSAVQPGFGYDGYLQNGVAYRVELDYRSLSKGVRDLSTSRVFVGMAIPVGSPRERGAASKAARHARSGDSGGKAGETSRGLARQCAARARAATTVTKSTTACVRGQ